MVNDIRAYRSAHKDGEWLTMSETAAALGVNNHRIRRLIKDGLLPAEQVVPRAPYQIRASDMEIGGSSTRLREQIARVASTPTTRSQCF